MEDDKIARAKRRCQKAQTSPKYALDLVHTEGCQVLPDRMELLKRLPRNGVAAEIGAAFGDFTGAILRLATPRKLHLIDMWEMERYQKGLDRIRETFAAEIEADRLAISRGYSTVELAKFDDAYFDWVYVDTNHSYATTLEELRIARDKVKPGGMIAGHDYCEGNVAKALAYGVIEACTEFCVTEGWRHRYLALDGGGHLSFCLVRL